MSKQQEAMRLALEALEYYQHRRLEWDYSDEVAITALRAALTEDALQKFTEVSQEIEAALAEPQRTLTDEVIADLWHQNGGFHHHFARAIERWLKGNP